MEYSYKIFLDVQVANQIELFKFISSMAVKEKIVNESNDFIQALLEREKISSTGLENGIAIPHGISDKILNHFIFIIRLKNHIEWQTLDNSKVLTIICFAVPKKTASNHLLVLQKVSTMLLDLKNQELLKKGKHSEINNLFASIFEKKEPNENFYLLNNKKDNLNLIEQKKQLIKENENFKNIEFENQIKEINSQIFQEKNKIKKYRVKLKIKQANLLAKYQSEIKLINKKISKIKFATKVNINAFKKSIADKKNKFTKLIANNSNEKKLLQDFKFRLFKEKNGLLKPLSQIKKIKFKHQQKYKEDKLALNNLYIQKMENCLKTFSNKNNFLYMNINKIQNTLMLTLAVISIWSIVVGALGIARVSEFIFSDISLWQTFDVSGFDLVKLNAWSSQIVSTNYNVALTTIIFGVISFLWLIPLKFFKMKNIIYKQKAYYFNLVGLLLLIIITTFLVLEIDNIQKYKILGDEAGKLDSAFSDLINLSSPIRNEEDFNSARAYDKYVENLSKILSQYGIDISVEGYFIQENIDIAFANAKINASEVFANEILKGNSLFF